MNIISGALRGLNSVFTHFPKITTTVSGAGLAWLTVSYFKADDIMKNIKINSNYSQSHKNYLYSEQSINDENNNNNNNNNIDSNNNSNLFLNNSSYLEKNINENSNNNQNSKTTLEKFIVYPKIHILGKEGKETMTGDVVYGVMILACIVGLVTNALNYIKK